MILSMALFLTILSDRLQYPFFKHFNTRSTLVSMTNQQLKPIYSRHTQKKTCLMEWKIGIFCFARLFDAVSIKMLFQLPELRRSNQALAILCMHKYVCNRMTEVILHELDNITHSVAEMMKPFL